MSNITPRAQPLPHFHGERLRDALKAHGIRTRHLAAAARVNRETVLRAMRGERVPGELLRYRLAIGLLFLGVPDAFALAGVPMDDAPLLGVPAEMREVRHAG